jgi:heme-degrading monooxygenase HmoA
VDEIWAIEQWNVKAGQEDEFVGRFKEFAEWTLDEFPDAVVGAAHLTQHSADPTRFVSFGRFASMDAFERCWRACTARRAS